MKEKTIFKTILHILGMSFLLNFIWENIQMPLYKGYSYTHFWQHIPICLTATIGDVLITLFLFIIFSIVLEDLFWYKKLNFKIIFLVVTMGGVINIVIEKIMLQAGWWVYTGNMPILPFIQVGFVPIIQMMTLPSLTFYIISRVDKN